MYTYNSQTNKNYNTNKIVFFLLLKNNILKTINCFFFLFKTCNLLKEI